MFLFVNYKAFYWILVLVNMIATMSMFDVKHW